MTIGVVYVVTGPNSESIAQMETEALRSSRLLRHFHPSLAQTVILGGGVNKEITEAFDSYKVLSTEHNIPGMISKILALAYSPYEKTLILDVDTLPVGNIVRGFDFIKGQRQLALSLAPRQEIEDEDGNSITHFQNGVMFVKKTERTLELFSQWYKGVCKNNPQGPTRFVFSRLLNKFHDVGIYPLSYYWNFRVDLLLDFNIHPRELHRVLPLIEIFHTHLKRKNAIKIVRQYSNVNLIKKVAKVSI